MPEPPNKPLSSTESPLQETPLSRTAGSAASGSRALRDSVKRFAAGIQKKHGLLDRKTADRLCRRLRYLITPRPRKGRPPEERITQATEMFERQRRKANGCRVDWNQIAQCCIPGYGRFRSMYRRRAELRKLQNAVYARLGRRDADKGGANHES